MPDGLAIASDVAPADCAFVLATTVGAEPAHDPQSGPPQSTAVSPQSSVPLVQCAVDGLPPQTLPWYWSLAVHASPSLHAQPSSFAKPQAWPHTGSGVPHDRPVQAGMQGGAVASPGNRISLSRLIEATTRSVRHTGSPSKCPAITCSARPPAAKLPPGVNVPVPVPRNT